MVVFLDRSKLSPSYIPRRLLHREAERSLLLSMVKSGLDAEGLGPVKAQVVGGVGAGKTTLCMLLGAELEKQYSGLRHLYVNLRRFSGGRVSIYRYMVRSVAEEAYSPSLSAEELLDNLLTYLSRKGLRLMVTFDEADHHVKQSRGRDTVIYDFTRLHEVSAFRPINIAAVLFVTRDPEYGGFLERPELSGLGVNAVTLKPYTKEQMFDIIAERVGEAFVRGSVPEEVVEYVAEFTSRSPYSGDVRYALDILLYSGNLAEARGRSRLTVEDVRYVLAETGPGVPVEALSLLERDAKALLLAVARTLAFSGKALVSREELLTEYEAVCEELGVGRVEVSETLKKMKQLGLISLDGKGNVGLVAVDGARLAAKLESYLKKGVIV
jgi:cell division control protein 6